MWLLLTVLVTLVFEQSIGGNVEPGTRGFHIRGWKFGRCAFEQFNNYAVNITNITISPENPRFPGPIFFHVTMDVKEDLPIDKIDMDLEIKKALDVRDGTQRWKVIPCLGWNIEDGCNGYGSCYYCNVLEQCNQTVVGAVKYVKECKIFKNMKDRVYHGNNNLCPPPKGQLTMTFSRIISSEDLSHWFIALQYTNEYWFTFNFKGGNDKKIGCARLWIDLCRYNLKDENQKCIKEPKDYSCCFGCAETTQAETIRMGMRG